MLSADGGHDNNRRPNLHDAALTRGVFIAGAASKRKPQCSSAKARNPLWQGTSGNIGALRNL
jgi:hypothetical protein